MTDPLILALCFFAGLALGWWQTLQACATAALPENAGRWAWWQKALYRVRQRREYAQFCREVEGRQPEVIEEFHRETR
jgi:hypothetical protein